MFAITTHCIQTRNSKLRGEYGELFVLKLSWVEVRTNIKGREKTVKEIPQADGK